MYCDYHVHSNFSCDSSYEMEDVIKDAIKLGLKEICFTDHVDYDIKADWDDENPIIYKDNKIVYNVNYPVYFEKLENFVIKYKDEINIKKGLEFGIQTHTIDKFQNLFNSYDLDFILLSIHQIDDHEFWTGEFQEGKTIKKCYDDYYDELFKIVQNYHDYSVLAHMDLMRRYVDDKKDYFTYCKNDIKSILEYIIRDGKGIEVNTSSFFYKIDGLTPSINIIKLYHELGGEIITIGSDSHNKERLGSHIKDIKEILKDIGFKYFCTFENMIPIFHNL